MLNQVPAQKLQTPMIKTPKVKSGIAQKMAPGEPEFAYLQGGLYRRPLINKGRDVASGVWAHMLGLKRGNNG